MNLTSPAEAPLMPKGEAAGRQTVSPPVRWAILGACLLSVLLFIAALPHFIRDMSTFCVESACGASENPPPGREWLTAHGFSPLVYAGAYAALYSLFALVYIAAALVLYRKKSGDRMGLLGMLTLVTFGVTFTPILETLKTVGPFYAAAVRLVAGLGISSFMLFFALFPGGTFFPRWNRWLVAFIILIRAPGLMFPDTVLDLQYWSQWWMGGWLLLWSLSMVGIQIYRYRRCSDVLERQQTKWVVFGLSLAVAGLLGITAVFLVFEEAILLDPVKTFVVDTGIYFSMTLIPATMLIALLRHRLWDIDPLVTRTLVYGALTVSVVAVYIGSVWYIGTILHTSAQWFVSLLATSLVAVMFAPLKERLQRTVNRMIYGEKDDPSSVLGRLGRQLEEPLPPEEALRVVVRTIREALRLPYASLTLLHSGEDLPVAEDGTPVPLQELERIPVIHRGEELGAVRVAPRSPGETFSSSDRAFLALLVRQAGVIVHGLRMSLDLRRLAADLQESRERLVRTREEERRRLRMNLHDDTAPRLAALALTAAAAEELMKSDPEAAKRILAELRSSIRRTVDDIRTLVYDLRPPALDELGLAGAIRERIGDLASAMHASGSGEPGGCGAIRFELDEPAAWPALPAAVEVAAYRIATEAMVNAVKHSRAACCRVTLRIVEDEGPQLQLWIEDDGIGMPPAGERTGARSLGMHTMRERASELGGWCTVEAGERGGTRVAAMLPIA
ncbi:signal transduction histidine kinase [Paenibacillus mucilaginosus]|uniref:GAF domain-containing sensor histidine kinase n=1 Tax=Paenibacillus mucilaginosus TaxID=61624 RepID=UPI003D2462D6